MRMIERVRLDPAITATADSSLSDIANTRSIERDDNACLMLLGSIYQNYDSTSLAVPQSAVSDFSEQDMSPL